MTFVSSCTISKTEVIVGSFRYEVWVNTAIISTIFLRIAMFAALAAAASIAKRRLRAG